MVIIIIQVDHLYGQCVLCVCVRVSFSQKHQVAALLLEAQKWKEKYATISLPDTRQLLVSRWVVVL